MALVRFALLVIIVSSIVTAPTPGLAQYMYLDLDGDGVHTYFDGFAFGQGPDTIDIYLTDVPCDGFESYTVNLFVSGTPMDFKSVQNMMPRMAESIPLQTYPYALTVGYSGAAATGPGPFHLLRITADYLPSDMCPGLSIVPSSCYSPPGVITSVGCPSVGEVAAFGDGFVGCTDMPTHKPLVTCPAEVQGREGEPMTFAATVTHPECGGYLFSFWSYGFPDGAVVSPLSDFHLGEATQTVTWTPAPGQAGEYTVTFEAQQPFPFNIFDDRRSTCMTRLVVAPSNAAPVADAGGPYSGLTGQPVMMTGTGSQDPDGDELTYSWEFGDGLTGAGATVSHSYTASGFYQVKLVVTDAVLYDEDGTTALIVDALGFDVFLTAGDKALRLDSGKPVFCLAAEPIRFPIEYVDIGSLEMAYGTSSIAAAAGKTSIGGDRDRDGQEELTVCFAKTDFQQLFSALPPGTNEITVTLRGHHQAGNPISGDVALTVIVRGSPTLSVSPNPLNPQGTITFTKTVAGMTRIHLLDVSGRLVRTVLESDLGVGVHTLPLEARDRAGSPLASGVYYLRVTDGEGTRARTVVITK